MLDRLNRKEIHIGSSLDRKRKWNNSTDKHKNQYASPEPKTGRPVWTQSLLIAMSADLILAGENSPQIVTKRYVNRAQTYDVKEVRSERSAKTENVELGSAAVK